LSSEIAWKARFSRSWNTRDVKAEAGLVRLSPAHLRVLVALEAYRQVCLPGLPGPAALSRVAKVSDETVNRALATFRARGLMPAGMQ
jgi:hypothetical protein